MILYVLIGVAWVFVHFWPFMLIAAIWPRVFLRLCCIVLGLIVLFTALVEKYNDGEQQEKAGKAKEQAYLESVAYPDGNPMYPGAKRLD
jgi:hypothetical protein